MGTIQSFYRHATPDFPLEVSYFAPYHIHQAPGLAEASDQMQISLVTGGQVEAHVGGNTYRLNTGDIFILRPYEVFTFRSTSLETKYVQLKFPMKLIAMPSEHFFQENFVQPIQSGMLIPPRLISPGDSLYDALLDALNRLDVDQEGTAAYTARLYSIVIELCTALMPYCTASGPKQVPGKTGENVIYTCINYIRENFSQNLTLRELAALVHLQPNYLCALFKKKTGRTIFDYITRLRINSASKLLRSTNLPVNLIAGQCGFPSISFFTRKFTALHGCSPSVYRKQFKERNLLDI